MQTVCLCLTDLDSTVYFSVNNVLSECFTVNIQLNCYDIKFAQNRSWSCSLGLGFARMQDQDQSLVIFARLRPRRYEQNQD